MPKPAPKKSPIDELEDAAVEDFISAAGLEGADSGAVKSALRDFVSACMQREEMGEYGEEETEEEG